MEYSAAYQRSVDKTAADRIVANWSGIRTMSGVRSIVAELINPTERALRPDALAILERSEVPREQIVSYILQGASTTVQSDLSTIRNYHFLLTQFPDDDRVVKFFSANLNDKRLPPPPPPNPRYEPSGEEAYRVCDGAFGSLIQVLEKRGEIKPGDAGYGDPGGEALQSQRDRNIAALKPFLIKSGYLDAIKSETKQPIEPPAPPPIPSPTPNPSTGVPAEDRAEHSPPASTHEMPATSPAGNGFARLLIPIFALSPIAWLLWKRRA